MAANSGKSISNYHFINSIQTRDLDQQIEDSKYEKQHKEDQKAQEFVKKGQDLFSIKGDHFKNMNLTLESYNKQLIR